MNEPIIKVLISGFKAVAVIWITYAWFWLVSGGAI
jgi:hypothetical protein